MNANDRWTPQDHFGPFDRALRVVPTLADFDDDLVIEELDGSLGPAPSVHRGCSATFADYAGSVSLAKAA